MSSGPRQNNGPPSFVPRPLYTTGEEPVIWNDPFNWTSMGFDEYLQETFPDHRRNDEDSRETRAELFPSNSSINYNVGVRREGGVEPLAFLGSQRAMANNVYRYQAAIKRTHPGLVGAEARRLLNVPTPPATLPTPSSLLRRRRILPDLPGPRVKRANTE